MGESEVKDAKLPAVAAAPAPVPAEKPVAKPAPKKDKKKDKKPSAPEAAPHVTGRLLTVDISASGVEFSLKGKKSKAEAFTLVGMDSSAVPAATALLAGLLASKTKLRVEFSVAADSKRTVRKLSAHN